MNKENDKLIDDLMKVFMGFKKVKSHGFAHCEGLTHNEKLIMFILHDISKDSKVSLADLRKRMELAPSTITPLIAGLEEKGFIERNIDKEDRRNIYLEISSKGKEHMNHVQKQIKLSLSEYINYMGDTDTKELIRLMSKTTEFYLRKEEEKE